MMLGATAGVSSGGVFDKSTVPACTHTRLPVIQAIAMAADLRPFIEHIRTPSVAFGGKRALKDSNSVCTSSRRTRSDSINVAGGRCVTDASGPAGAGFMLNTCIRRQFGPEILDEIARVVSQSSITLVRRRMSK